MSKRIGTRTGHDLNKRLRVEAPAGWPADVSLEIEEDEHGTVTVAAGIKFHVSHSFTQHEIVNHPAVLERLKAGIVNWISHGDALTPAERETKRGGR